jgi:hypothetical protein
METWGVKCISDLGWYGRKHPARMTEAEARELATALNLEGEDRWEAQPLPETKTEEYKHA